MRQGETPRKSKALRNNPIKPSLEKEKHLYFDRVELIVQGGHGGDGAVVRPDDAGVNAQAAERSELVMPPGGAGGGVLLYVDPALTDLLHLRVSPPHSRPLFSLGDVVTASSAIFVAQPADAPLVRCPVSLGMCLNSKRREEAPHTSAFPCPHVRLPHPPPQARPKLTAECGRDSPGLLTQRELTRLLLERKGSADAGDELSQGSPLQLNGATLRVSVPPGTFVKTAGGKSLGDLVTPGQQLLVASGGEGGPCIVGAPRGRVARRKAASAGGARNGEAEGERHRIPSSVLVPPLVFWPCWHDSRDGAWSGSDPRAVSQTWEPSRRA